MSLDENMAPYVSLVPTPLPGDIYMFVAEKVWDRLEKEEAKLSAAITDRFDEVFGEIGRLQKDYDDAPKGSEVKVQAWEAVQEYRNKNRKLREQLFSVFWNRITDPKIRRKIAKR